jgi:hypothetical protein
MHHSLRLYSKYQRRFLRLYISLAKLTGVPLLGGLVRRAANFYGRHGHGGYFLTAAEAERIIDASRNVALGPCRCRQAFHNCDRPVMSEIVIGTGAEVFSQTGAGEFRPISKEKAKEVLRQCRQENVMHTIMKCQQHFYAICSCCSCCCVPTRLRQNYGIEYALVRSTDVVGEFQRHHF